MNKNFWVLCSFLCGIVLCVFSNSAFAVVGVVVGTIGIVGGIYFIVFLRSNGLSALAIGAGLILLGLVLIILCIFLEPVAYFLGGIIMATAGIMLLIFCRIRDRLVLGLAIGCLVSGVLILFMPAFVGWLTVAIGIGLIIYSGLVLVYMR